ncbi:MAG: S9 family peptidase [Acidobacteriota bacterium]
MTRLRRCLPLFLLASLLFGTAPMAVPPPADLSVEEALAIGASSPLPSELQWMPGGGRFCYIAPHAYGEAADLLSYDLQSGKTSPVLTQEQFRAALGQQSVLSKDKLGEAKFTGYRLSHTGRYLLLESNEGDFVWDLPAHALTRLTQAGEGAENPAWSPDDSRLAYAEGGNLWVVDRATGAKKRVAEGKAPLVTCGVPDWLYGEELDMTTAFWWSPDGSRIAYLRFDETGVPTYPIIDQRELQPGVRHQFYPRPGQTNPSVSLWVVPAGGGQAALVPGAESGQGYLPRVAWVPGGKTITYELLDRAQQKLTLYAASPGAGQPKELLQESSPTWVNVLEGPRFLKDGQRFLWLSERDGFAHIYLYDLQRGLVRRLTSGPWVVDDILAVDPSEKRVFFSANKDEATGRQICSVSLEGRDLRTLSKGEGWHEATFSPSAKEYLDDYSRAGVPADLTLTNTATGRQHLVAAGQTGFLQTYGFVKPEFMSLRAADGTVLHAEVIKPRGYVPGRRYPAVVEVYGGPDFQIVQDRFEPRWATIDQLFAQAGFVYFMLDNRGSSRRGTAFEGVLLDRMGKTELEDQLTGAAALKKLPYVDPQRIGIWGWSYGGFMTLYSLTHSDAFNCGVSVAPVTNWLNYDTCYTERYLKLPKDDEAGYSQSSPVHDAADLHVPLLIAQGLVDDNVHFGNSAQMVSALYAAAKPFDMAYYPGMDHSIRGPAERTDLFKRILAFFRLHLAAGESNP